MLWSDEVFAEGALREVGVLVLKLPSHTAPLSPTLSWLLFIRWPPILFLEPLRSSAPSQGGCTAYAAVLTSGYQLIAFVHVSACLRSPWKQRCVVITAVNTSLTSAPKNLFQQRAIRCAMQVNL